VTSYKDLHGNQWAYNESNPPRFWAHHCSYCWPHINHTQVKEMSNMEGCGLAPPARDLMRQAICRKDVVREARDMVDLDIPADPRFAWLWKRQPYTDWRDHNLTDAQILASLPEDCRKGLSADFAL
jgi:hypothetical protein